MLNDKQKVEPTSENGNSTKPPVSSSFLVRAGKGQSEADWIEDFTHENGNYMNKCINCEEMFFGHKRRVVCRICANGKK